MSDAATSNAAPTDLIELGRISAAYGVKAVSYTHLTLPTKA